MAENLKGCKGLKMVCKLNGYMGIKKYDLLGPYFL
jgi:hypothetical protein